MDNKQMRKQRNKPWTGAPRRRGSGPLGVWPMLATAMAATAIAVRQRAKKAERDNPPTGKFVTVDGVRLHYIEHGDGESLVLLHGNGTMAEEMVLSGLVECAASRYRVIVFDRPGYGYSERPRHGRDWGPEEQADLIHHALKKIGVEQATLLGHSWGTLVAVAFGLQFPAATSGLVLLSGYYFPSLRFDSPIIATGAIPVLGHIMRYTSSPVLGRLFWPALMRGVFGPSAMPEQFAAYPKWMSLRPGQLYTASAEAALMLPAAARLCQRYRELAMPVSIVSGVSDRLVKVVAQSGRLHREIPHSELIYTSHAGHMVHHLDTEEVMAAIDRNAERASHAPPANATVLASAPTVILADHRGP